MDPIRLRPILLTWYLEPGVPLSSVQSCPPFCLVNNSLSLLSFQPYSNLNMSHEPDNSSNTNDSPLPALTPTQTSLYSPPHLLLSLVQSPYLTSPTSSTSNSTTQTNLAWKKKLFSTFLKSDDLFGFVEGSQPCPDSTDLMYVAWCRTDQNIRSWLFSTLSETLLEEVHDPGTTQVWDNLHTRVVELSCVMYLQGLEAMVVVVDNNTMEAVEENLIEGVVEAVVASITVVLVVVFSTAKHSWAVLRP
ncbi:hypothetical protein CRG98_050411 [Punica granatum]|uniref:Retrotransposon Copia-like N-terminal domain-containing protein n=1 Tax=Punica granatum TaxID=22663 RepID=A0A2I0GBM6_PUNGR|nr:hypothetical protein CRG98_050411 [Punica granatum]